MKRRTTFFGALVLCLCTVVSVGRTAQVRYMGPRELGDASALVVSGTVAETRSYWNESGTKIFTEVRVRVAESYKGAAPPEVRIVQLGGVVGHVRMNVSGALRWRSGEEVLLFLEQHDTGRYRVSGFSQGKFAIDRDPATGEAFIRNAPVEGIELIGAPGGAASDARASGVPINRFVNEALGSE